MSRSRPPLPPELHAFLEWESAIPPLPRSVRARAVARARAALAMGRAIPFVVSGQVPRIRGALALTAAVATAATAGVIGYELGGWYERAAARTEATTHVVVPVRAPYTASPAIAVVPSAAVAATGPALRPSPAQPEPDELLLLDQARSAVADRDFASALVPIGEHARRFESGLLAEEREALRVRALSGLGRTEGARRAANAFETRFPHSVLLGAVRRMAASKP
jgi:hypothetical protein